jgi:hypothetical protein
MAQANDSIDVTPGTGADVATHLVGGKEYQVMTEATPNGNLIGDIPTYSVFQSIATSGGTSRVMGNLMNWSGSGKIVKVRKWFIQPSGATVTGVPQTWRVSKTSNNGSGSTLGNIRKHDNSSPTLTNSEVTYGFNQSTVPTSTFVYFEMSINIEETIAPWGMTPYYSILPTEGDNITDYTLNPGEGLMLENVTGLAYTYGMLVVFSAE